MPHPPWSIALLAFTVLFFGQCAMGGMRVGRAYTIVTQYPDVSIGVNDRPLGEGEVRRHSFGRRLGHPLGGTTAGDMTFVDFSAENARCPIGIQQFVLGAGEVGIGARARDGRLPAARARADVGHVDDEPLLHGANDSERGARRDL